MKNSKLRDLAHGTAYVLSNSDGPFFRGISDPAYMEDSSEVFVVDDPKPALPVSLDFRSSVARLGDDKRGMKKQSREGNDVAPTCCAFHESGGARLMKHSDKRSTLVQAHDRARVASLWRADAEDAEESQPFGEPKGSAS